MKNNFQFQTNAGVRLLPAAGNSLAWMVMVMVAFLAMKSADAQTYKVLYMFTGGKDGSSPLYQLVRVGENLYGTALGGASGDGVVFKLAEDGRETVLHSFSGDDGDAPAGLVRDAAGNLYGLTQLGGNVGCNVYAEPNGCGVIFEITRSGEFSVLYSFSGDGGANPAGKLLLDGKGNLYGAAAGGGQSPSCPGPEYEQGCGTIFELTRGAGAWNQTVLYNFAGGNHGFDPNGSLISFAGKLFGAADRDNSQPCRSELCGAVFELAPGNDGWTEKILHSFDGEDGAISEGGLIADPQGNLYGTTYSGGASGTGTIFKIDPQGHKTILHSFDGRDGANPFAGLVRDGSGNLFGTAVAGGSSNQGTVFRLDSANHLTVLYNFKGGKTDGAGPYGTLLLAGETLYGTTAAGGHHNSGTVFEISK